LVDTLESYGCYHTGKEWPNTHAHTYDDAHKQKKKPKKERKKKKIMRKTKSGRGGEEGKKREKERGKRKRKRGWGEEKGKRGSNVFRGLGAWVLRRSRPHTNHARST